MIGTGLGLLGATRHLGGARELSPPRGGESARAQFFSARPLETANAARFPTRRVGGEPEFCKPPDGSPGPRRTTIFRAWELWFGKAVPLGQGRRLLLQNSPPPASPRFESAEEEEVGPRSGGTAAALGAWEAGARRFDSPRGSAPDTPRAPGAKWSPKARAFGLHARTPW